MNLPRVIVITIIIIMFFISLSIPANNLLRYSPTYFIFEPDAINKTFTFSSDASESIAAISIKNVGKDIATLHVTSDGNNIKDANSLVTPLNKNIKYIFSNISELENASDNGRNAVKMIRLSTAHIEENVSYLDNGIFNLTSFFENISMDIKDIDANIRSLDRSPNNLIVTHIITNLKNEIASIKWNTVNSGAIFISLRQSTKIDSGETGFISVNLYPSFVTTNGQYKGSLIITANDITKSIPLSFEIKGITSKSTESKAKENKSVSFKIATINMTGSLSS